MEVQASAMAMAHGSVVCVWLYLLKIKLCGGWCIMISETWVMFPGWAIIEGTPGEQGIGEVSLEATQPHRAVHRV